MTRRTDGVAQPCAVLLTPHCRRAGALLVAATLDHCRVQLLGGALYLVGGTVTCLPGTTISNATVSVAGRCEPRSGLGRCDRTACNMRGGDGEHWSALTAGPGLEGAHCSSCTAQTEPCCITHDAYDDGGADHAWECIYLCCVYPYFSDIRSKVTMNHRRSADHDSTHEKRTHRSDTNCNYKKKATTMTRATAAMTTTPCAHHAHWRRRHCCMPLPHCRPCTGLRHRWSLASRSRRWSVRWGIAARRRRDRQHGCREHRTLTRLLKGVRCVAYEA
jgi:hypothetical protein